MKKFSHLKAITYTTKLNLENILSDVGDSINVYIPAPHFILENPVLAEQIVYGQRPYSIKSDLVAICAHMGILFPGEKPKKNSPDILLTSPNAPFFGRSSVPFDETRKIEDDFHFYGVLINVIAVQGRDSYSSSRGIFFPSQSIKDGLPLGIDILDYSFITEFEPMPELVDDPSLILVKNSPEDFYTPVDEENLLSYEYSPSLFKSDKEGYLFRDFKVLIHTNGEVLQFKWTRNNICLLQKANPDKGEEEKILATGLQFKNINFLEKSIRVGEMNFEPIDLITLSPPDGPQAE